MISPNGSCRPAAVRAARIRAMALCLAALPLAGCGYQQAGDFNRPPEGAYQWRSLYREDISSVAIPIFQNKDFRRGIEFKLTKAVVNQLEAHSPYKVVARERADTVLDGEIVSANVSTLSKLYRNNVPQEQLIVLTVNFTWTDQRTGKILLERRNFQQSASWFPTLGEGEFVGQQQAVEKLALSIVQELQAEW